MRAVAIGHEANGTFGNIVGFECLLNKRVQGFGAVQAF